MLIDPDLKGSTIYVCTTYNRVSCQKNYAHIIEQAQSDYLILQFHTYKIFLKSEQGIVAENSKRSK